MLPFQNFGGKSEDDYFVDGMTESLITDLARVGGLLVIARNSVFVYKGKPVDVRRVGRELDVRYVLEGSVQRAGDTVRVNAQLVDASSGFHVWAEKYDRPLKELFAVQDEIAAKIAAALRLALRPAEAGARSATPAPDREAYDQYLRGMFFVNQELWPEKDKGIPFLEKAVALDPGFARAHAALASEYARKSFERDPDRAWAQRAFVEIEKTLALDPGLPGAYVARHSVTWNLENGFPHEQAGADLKKALALDPSFVPAHDGLGTLYMHVGLLDEALRELATAIRLDPRDTFAPYRVARIHMYQGRYEEAVAELRARWPGDFQMPIALAHLGRLAEARRAAGAPESALGGHGARPDAASSRAVLEALAHRPADAEREIAVALTGAGSSHFHHAAYNVATAYALLGKKSEALEWLERVAREGMPCTPLFEKDPFLDSLRGDPAFQAFLARTRETTERLRKVL